MDCYLACLKVEIFALRSTVMVQVETPILNDIKFAFRAGVERSNVAGKCTNVQNTHRYVTPAEFLSSSLHVFTWERYEWILFIRGEDEKA